MTGFSWWNPSTWGGGGQAAPAGLPMETAAPTGGVVPAAPALSPASGALGGAAVPAGLGSGLGLNIGTGQLALGALGSLGSLYTGMQAHGLAKKQFGLTQQVLNTNLTNSIRSYNTGLEDRARARGVTEGQSSEQVTDYVNRNRLSR